VLNTQKIVRIVSGASIRHLIPTDRVPAVGMNGWHVARHWAAGVGVEPPSHAVQWRQNAVDV